MLMWQYAINTTISKSKAFILVNVLLSFHHSTWHERSSSVLADDLCSHEDKQQQMLMDSRMYKQATEQSHGTQYW